MTKMLIGTEKDYQDIILKAKKKVFDELDMEMIKHKERAGLIRLEIMEGIYNDVKKCHLSTFAEQRRNVKMPNKQTQEASIKIVEMLGKLWDEGDISSEQSNKIMEVVREELDGILPHPHNNDLIKVCSKCGHELSEYSILEDGVCNQCSVGMKRKPISKS